MFYANTRCGQILNLLLVQTKYITLDQLATEMKVSKRTVYYDICKINLWLEQEHLQQIETVRDKGIFIAHRDRGTIRQLMDSAEAERTYIFSPEERTRIIICAIIYREEKIHIDQLAECCNVSRNTILSDMKEAEKILGQYDLKIEYSPKKGYDISGDTVRIRALFIMYFQELSALFNGGNIRFFKREDVEKDYDRLKDIESRLGISYVDGALLPLAALMPVMRRNDIFAMEGVREEEIVRTKEYELAAEAFPELAGNEKIYLALHLLGSRVNIVPDEYFESPSKQYVRDLTRMLISEFERTACVSFEMRDELEHALFVHLSTSMYRYCYGVQIGNVMGDDIMNEYPELFALTKLAAGKLEEAMGVPIPDGEIAYLALHFGAFLRISDNDSQEVRILIVCVNGISTGNMLRREIQRLLPFAQIVDVVSAVQVASAQNICDLIISTVKLQTAVPTITVHPILTELDRRTILGHRLISQKTVCAQSDRLFDVIKKYVSPDDYDALRADLAAFFRDGKNNPHSLYAGNDMPSVIDASRIRIFDGPCSWQESIRRAGSCLVDYKSIEKKYLDAIIDQLQYYGPYMFLTEEVILAHARPEDGVNCLDISLAVFRQPVEFGRERNAKLVFVLAAADQERHLKILQDMLELLRHPDFVERVMECASSADVYYEITRILLNGDREESA